MKVIEHLRIPDRNKWRDTPCERIGVDEVIDRYKISIDHITSIHRNLFELEFSYKTPTHEDYDNLNKIIYEETKELTEKIVRLEKLRLETRFMFPI